MEKQAKLRRPVTEGGGNVTDNEFDEAERYTKSNFSWRQFLIATTDVLALITVAVVVLGLFSLGASLILERAG
jgi:hypothetical protein